MNKDMQLIRACEMAAICALPKIGCGDKNAVDGEAVRAMREMLAQSDFKTEVIVGEGELDEAPMLYIGEKLGKGDKNNTELDLAVDPVEGTSGCASGKEFSGAVLAASKKGSMIKVPEMYMAKFFISRKWADKFKKDYKFVSTKEAFLRLQKISGKKDLVGYTIDRPRNDYNVKFIEENGGVVKKFKDGGVLASIDCITENVDFVFGIMGSPEGVAMAALAKAHGGAFFGRFKRYDEIYPEDKDADKRTAKEIEVLKSYDLEMGVPYSADVFCNDNKARFICSGITTVEGSSIKPIIEIEHGYKVQTIFVSHGITRYIYAEYKTDLVKELIPSVFTVLKKEGIS